MLTRFQVKLFRLIANIIAIFPSRSYPILSRFVLFIAGPFLKKDREKLRRNVSQVYKLPAHSSFMRSFEKQVFQHQAVSFLETLGSIMNPSHQLEIKDLGALQQVVSQHLAKNRGLIVITGHMGSWELVAKSIAKVSQQEFHALAKPSKLAAFTKFLASLRAQMATKVLWTDRKSILKDMMQVLKDGDCLGFVMDQKPDARIGPVVDFLGLKTEFVSGPAKLAIRFKSPVLAVFCMREGPMSYRVCFETVLEGDEADLNEVEATQKMANAIEQMIRLYPEQWVWNYKRWRFAQ